MASQPDPGIQTAQGQPGAASIPQGVLAVYDMLTAEGLSPAAASGAAGNIWAESGGNPNSYNPNENAHGLANWEGGRWPALQQFAASINQPVNSLTAQLAFLWYELTNSYGSTYKALQNNGLSAGQAAAIFASGYEGCLDCTNVNSPSVQARIAYANQVYAATGGAPGSYTPPAGSGSSGGATSGTPTATLDSSNSNCQIGFSIPIVGHTCLWQAGWTRAVAGGGLIAAGGLIALVGVSLLVMKQVPLPGALGMVTGTMARSIKGQVRQ